MHINQITKQHLLKQRAVVQNLLAVEKHPEDVRMFRDDLRHIDEEITHLNNLMTFGFDYPSKNDN